MGVKQPQGCDSPPPAPCPPSLNLSFQISGTWSSLFMASDNMTRIRENGDLRLFIRKINILKNGSLKFDFHFMCVLSTAPPCKLRLGETVSPCCTGTSYAHTPACLGQCVNGHQPFPGDHHDGVGGALAYFYVLCSSWC